MDPEPAAYRPGRAAKGLAGNARQWVHRRVSVAAAGRVAGPAKRPGPGSLWVLAALTSPWQCWQVSTGWVMFPQVSCTSTTGGPPGPGAYVSPQLSSAAMTGNSARPGSVRRYSYRGGCSL